MNATGAPPRAHPPGEDESHFAPSHPPRRAQKPGLGRLCPRTWPPPRNTHRHSAQRPGGRQTMDVSPSSRDDRTLRVPDTRHRQQASIADAARRLRARHGTASADAHDCRSPSRTSGQCRLNRRPVAGHGTAPVPAPLRHRSCAGHLQRWPVAKWFNRQPGERRPLLQAVAILAVHRALPGVPVTCGGGRRAAPCGARCAVPPCVIRTSHSSLVVALGPVTARLRRLRFPDRAAPWLPRPTPGRPRSGRAG